MATLGDWSTHDNKKYIGKLDRIYVSKTETMKLNTSLTTTWKHVIIRFLIRIAI